MSLTCYILEELPLRDLSLTYMTNNEAAIYEQTLGDLPGGGHRKFCLSHLKSCISFLCVFVFSICVVFSWYQNEVSTQGLHTSTDLRQKSVKECFGIMVVLNLGDFSIEIEEFNGSHFGVWETRIQDCLYQTEDLYLALAGYERKPAGMSDEQWHLLDRRALGIARLCLDSSIASNFTKKTTTKGLMDALALVYETVPNRVFLMRKLWRMIKPESRPMQDHLNEFNTLIQQLRSLGVEFDDELKALNFLVTLPSSWDPLVTAIGIAYGTRKLNYNDVVSTVLDEDLRRMSSEECPSVGRSTASSTSRGGKGGGRRSKSRDRFQSKAHQRECWNCGKTGHLKKDCWAPKK